jgi:heme a synthase
VPSLGFRILALSASLSAWALVVVGGLVRVTESGLGCPDWPLCHGNVVPADRQAPAIEYSHRATATVVTLLVVATAVWAWRGYRHTRRDIVVPALVAAVLVPFQALLGAVVVWLELPTWIVAVHFVVGIVFLSTTAVTAARACRGPVAGPAGFARTALAAVASVLVLVSLGGAVVATNAGVACGRQWPACNSAFAAGGTLAELQVAHRLAAYLVAGFAIALTALAWRRGGPRLIASLPLAAIAAQIGIGIAMVLTPDESSARRTLEILHVAGAGAVSALLVALVATVGLPRRPRLSSDRVVPARA